MSETAELHKRLDVIEGLLRELLGKSSSAINSSIPIEKEIAMVKASGGDLVAHLKAKSKARMAELRRQKSGKVS